MQQSSVALFGNLLYNRDKKSVFSSVGRVLVSKTSCRRFKSYKTWNGKNKGPTLDLCQKAPPLLRYLGWSYWLVNGEAIDKPIDISKFFHKFFTASFAIFTMLASFIFSDNMVKKIFTKPINSVDSLLISTPTEIMQAEFYVLLRSYWLSKINRVTKLARAFLSLIYRLSMALPLKTF